MGLMKVARAAKAAAGAIRDLTDAQRSRGARSRPAKSAGGDAGTLADRVLRGQEPALLDALARKLKGRV